MIKRRILFIIRDIINFLFSFSDIEYQLDFYYKEENKRDFLELEIYQNDFKEIIIYIENRYIIFNSFNYSSNEEKEIKIKIF